VLFINTNRDLSHPEIVIPSSVQYNPMDEPTMSDALDLDPTIEAEVRLMLIEHYAPIYKQRVNAYVDMCLATEGFTGRFLYLKEIIGEDKFSSQASIFISGFGMGSEMLIARHFGFGKIYGVEVEQILVEATKKRLQNYPDMYPIIYDGEVLPYEDDQFNLVLSGHVIEHTSDPSAYLREILRVLIPGGYLFLEFPTRYYKRELHTGLPSFEWLPRPVRNLTLQILSSKVSVLNKNVKERYSSIVTTNLQQISLGMVKRMLNKIEYSAAIMDHVSASPGIIRCIIRKN
jgi:ubiquinone/menaquinone biosynthesis C-methylase UbiE